MIDKDAEEMIERQIVHRRFCWTCHGFRDRDTAGVTTAPERCRTPKQCITLAEKNPA